MDLPGLRNGIGGTCGGGSSDVDTEDVEGELIDEGPASGPARAEVDMSKFAFWSKPL